MSLIKSRLLNNWRFWRALALVFCSGIIAIGCGGSGGGGLPDSPDPCSQPSDPCYDPEGSTPGKATRIWPDGAGFSGRINFERDVDWFKFSAGQDITYTLQIFGFPKDPDPFNPDPSLFPEDDLTGPGEWELEAQIVSLNGADQIANSTGTEGGEPYDIDPAGFPEPPEGVVYVGDNRIVWVSPTTQDYFIRVAHMRQSGSGHYVLNLASSQMGVMRLEPGRPRVQWAERNVTVINDEGCVAWTGDAWAWFQFPYWEDSEMRVISAGGDAIEVFFVTDCEGTTNEEPETVATHFHWGIPDIKNPQNSDNFQVCDPGDPHCWFWDFTPPGFPADDIVRTMYGFPWYADVHFTDNYEWFSQPIAVSLPNGDFYGLFESALLMSASNVRLPDGSRIPEFRQSHIPDFYLFYDSSLKAIQVARRMWNNPSLGGLFLADTEWYEGDILTVYKRGSAGLPDRVIVPPNVIPGPKEPPFFDELVGDFNQGESRPGFRNVIHQLSDSQTDALREAYYDTGIYFEVTDTDGSLGLGVGAAVARADVAPNDPSVRSLEIQQDPDPTIFFPDRASQGPLKKGTINFVSDYAEGGQITVVSNGKILGVLSDFLDEGLESPECGETLPGQSLTAEYWPHSYPYKAVAEDGTEWQGHFEIRGGACETLVLSVE